MPMRAQEILLSIVKRLPISEFSPKMYVEINEIADIGESLFNTNMNLRINSDKFYLRGWSESMTRLRVGISSIVCYGRREYHRCKI